MKAIRIHQHGGPEVLTYEETPDPSPGPGEPLIDVQAVGVNYADVNTRSGKLKIRIQTFPLSDAREAHRQLEGRHTTGKPVLIP